MSLIRHIHGACISAAFLAGGAFAQTLELRFENSLVGQGGETPVVGDGVVFRRGFVDRGAEFGAITDVQYAASGKLDATEGTLEFWVKPSWSGDDGAGHAFLHWGSYAGGMLFIKDGASNLRAIFNQFGPGGVPEMDVGFGVSAWEPNRWHHVAATWSNIDRELRLYMDGELREQIATPALLPAITDPTFRLGRNWGDCESLSVLDEVRVFSAPRTTPQIAADYAADIARHPSFVLPFENDLAGEDGEVPTSQAGVTYAPGVAGNCAVFGPAAQLWYLSSGNISATEGTLEFWLRPAWNGDDGESHTILGWGEGGGMLFAKDGASNLRVVFNRFGINGIPEMGLGFGVPDWVAGQWHHVAYTWSDTEHRAVLYIDGALKTDVLLSAGLPDITAGSFGVGIESLGGELAGSLDELRVYPFARTADQIMADMAGDIHVLAIDVTPASDTLYPTWRAWPTVYGQTVIGSVLIHPGALRWESSDPGVVEVQPQGVLRAVGPGNAVLTASFGVHTDTMDISVVSPARAVEEPGTWPYLTEPALGFVYEQPVISIRYIPTPDGVNVDDTLSGWTGTVEDMLDWINRIEVESKFMLEEGSRFRGYANPAARPSMGYRVVRTINIFEPIPPDRNTDHPTGAPGVYYPDYMSILNRFGLQELVENQGVREVWMWGYHHGEIAPVESNMASPVTGDISNSNRFPDDLPIFNNTYVLYNYNWTRSSNESVHDHGHQIEAVLAHANQTQDSNTDLFWKRFVGQDDNGAFITGRCGWTHMPPNTTNHYDYENLDYAPSDIFDWRPNGGTVTDVNADTWGQLQYAWPSGSPPGGLTEHNWYVFWMQAIPGLDSGIAHQIGPGTLTNWWSFIGDWDRIMPAAGSSLGLHTQLGPLAFTQDPQSQSACVGGSISLHAAAQGAGPVSYRWRINGEWLGNGPTGHGSECSGAFTDTFAIFNAQPGDAGWFQCVVTDSVGSLASAAALVSVSVCCDPDVNCDGAVNGFDIEATEQAVNGDFTNFCQPTADLNGDGAENGFDIETEEQRVNGAPCE